MECTSFNWGSIFRSLGKLLASDRLLASQLEQQKLRYIDYSIFEGKALARGKKPGPRRSDIIENDATSHESDITLALNSPFFDSCKPQLSGRCV